MKNYGVLFDLDGTLLDTLQDLTDAVNHTLREFHCPPRTAMQVRAALGSGALHLIKESLPEGPDAPDAQAVLTRYKAYYKAHCQEKTRAYDGIPEALEQLAKECRIGIVSNKPDLAVKPLCSHYFPGTYALGETEDCPRKPAPDMLLKAMKALDITKCVYVGDSEVDVQTAKNAGMPCISVSWGFRDREYLLENGAEHMCDRPQELPRMVEELLHD